MYKEIERKAALLYWCSAANCIMYILWILCILYYYTAMYLAFHLPRFVHSLTKNLFKISFFCLPLLQFVSLFHYYFYLERYCILVEYINAISFDSSVLDTTHVCKVALYCFVIH